jgi:hypothetical protein
MSTLSTAAPGPLGISLLVFEFLLLALLRRDLLPLLLLLTKVMLALEEELSSAKIPLANSKVLLPLTKLLFPALDLLESRLYFFLLLGKIRCLLLHLLELLGHIHLEPPDFFFSRS